MNKFLLLLNLVQFVIIMILSNPTEMQHRAYVTEQIKTRLQSNTGWVDKLRGAVDSAQGLVADYHNRYVYSTLSKDGKTLTVGILGMVRWVADDEQPAPATQPAR